MKFLRKIFANSTVKQSLNSVIISAWMSTFCAAGTLILEGKPTWTLLVLAISNAAALTYAYITKQHLKKVNAYKEAYARIHDILTTTFKRERLASFGVLAIAGNPTKIPTAIDITTRNSYKPRMWGMRVRVYNDLDHENNGEWILSYGHVNADIQDNANWRKTGMKIIIGFMLCLFSCGVDYEYIDGVPGGIYKTLSVSLYSEGICPGYYPTMVLKLDEPRGEPRKELAKMKSCDIGYILTASDYGAKLDLSLVRDLPAPGWMDSTVLYIAIVTFDSVVVYRDTVNFEGFKFTIPQR